MTDGLVPLGQLSMPITYHEGWRINTTVLLLLILIAKVVLMSA